MKLTVNGKSRDYAGNPFKRLIDVLREDFALTGTKEGCGEGECGACTVVLDGRTVNSCLIPVAQAEGKEVRTIESFGTPGKLHPMQKAFLEHGGAQCGICTPGMIVSAACWAEAPGPKNDATCRQALAGNLCRCTGYQHIVDSVLAATKKKGGKKRARR
ncbi:MAG: (2Fe-2S)-binding protein [Elusimicrobia bacterium]|nr:(2Fe-2S)-binding protein [Elusimicrobiota bacterium]